MTDEPIKSKWKFIADWLIELKAPKKVINAAIEVDNALIALSLGHNTREWEEDYDIVKGLNRSSYTALHNLIMDDLYCTACEEVNSICRRCRFGDHHHCTPRSRHADDYFSIVRQWIQKHINEEV